MKERIRFEHEIELLSETSGDSSEKFLVGEAEQAKGSDRTVTSLRMRKSAADTKLLPLRARILWPALGFPAVIAPRDKQSASESPEGDATRCICVLLLSNREYLSKEEAAQYLRYVPWGERGRRHIPYGQIGTFREQDLNVLNYYKKPPLFPGQKDSLGELIAFGANHNGENGIVANLARRVREFYRQGGLQHLHEIRVYEAASKQLNDGLYHLFWNNEAVNENAPSDEMDHLLRHFAPPLRKKEYEYEYGSLHLPYSIKNPRERRAEILHPLFVRKRPSAVLRIGHLTDTHVDIRADVYEENLKLSSAVVTYTNAYNNWNKNFIKAYNSSKSDSDILLLTGDIIDYGRGHQGLDKQDRKKRYDLDDNDLYQVNRNWFLFYYLLASGDAYNLPVYTALGNHDWRLNPYPPFAFAGSPSPRELFFDAIGFSPEEQKAALRKAHGPGHDRLLSYSKSVESKYRDTLKAFKEGSILDKLRKLYKLADKVVIKILGGKRTLNIPGFPTETKVESVEWYLLSINPFLDYQFTLPSRHSVLMLDWAQDETLIFDDIYQGKRYGLAISTNEGPKARNCLTTSQTELVKQFTESRSAAKIIGIHAPPIGPWHDWYDYELRHGWKEFDLGGRGYPHYSAKTSDGKTIKGHPLFAIQPAKGIVQDAVYGMDARFGSFEKNRCWFIKRLADQKYHVRVVLSGHIHRQGLFVTYKAPESFGQKVAGEMFIKYVTLSEAFDVAPPAGAQVKIRRNSKEFGLAPGPLYINSTSIGPRGHFYPAKGKDIYLPTGYTHVELVNDGTIKKVVFKSV